MRHEDIALALGISTPTLRKHFETELSVGAATRRVEVLEALQRQAKKGSTSAARAYLAHEPQVAAPPPEPAGSEASDPEQGEKPLKRGKKEQAQADASTAQVGTEWGDLLPSTATKQ